MDVLYVNWTGNKIGVRGPEKGSVLNMVDGDEPIRIVHGYTMGEDGVDRLDRWTYPALPAEEDGVVHVVTEHVASILYPTRDDVAVPGEPGYQPGPGGTGSGVMHYRRLVRVRHTLPDRWRSAEGITGTFTDPRTVDSGAA